MAVMRNELHRLTRLRRFPAGLAVLVALGFGLQVADAAGPPLPKKIVLIAGKKSHGPVGNGIHDYPWSVKLIKVMLDHSNVAGQVRVEYHLDGWPRDEKTLDAADAIMVISDGRDGDRFEEAPHFRSAEHLRAITRQMRRGCGFLTFHFSTFASDAFANEILEWNGGYFDWETDGKRKWYSAITTRQAEVRPATPGHPVLRGVRPFVMKEEFYYNIRFAPGDPGLTPIWVVPDLGGRADQGNVVAWVRQRADGGRGFGTTCGHFYENWKQDDFRRLILNAIVWAAHVDVPAGGVSARYHTQAEITAALAGGTD
jgi:type 1 glutamine amidotransferase